MPLHSCIQHTLDNYLSAMSETFARHPMAHFLRHDFPNAVAKAAGEYPQLVFKGSAGQANWVRGPWVAAFDPVITTSAQKGYYPVYLFREDMTGLYLSLNQAMTEAKQYYKSDAKTALRARAANYRAMLGAQIKAFSDQPIDLAPSSPSNDTAFYEAGNIFAKYYSVGHIPGDSELVADLNNMLNLYQALILVETTGDMGSATEDDEPIRLHLEDATKFRLHKRIERNAALSKAVKKVQGCTCKICGLNFEATYGKIGEGYIEAHHLKPLSAIRGTKVELDPAKDFAVLCANCHRMIHRAGCVDIETFKREHYRGGSIHA